jgi:hypothetical protein
MDFEAVRQIAQSFPGVEPGFSYGQPAFKIGGKMFACFPSHRSAEPGSLVVRIDFDRRAELLAEAPDFYYLTDHYVGYPAVLVRLRKIKPDALRGLLAGALQLVQTRPPKRRPRKSARS